MVENKPGGGTMIALGTVAKSQPDGYTLATISGSHTVNPAVRKSMPYKFEELTGVTLFVESPTALAANKDFPADNLAELIALAKSRSADDLIAYATPGQATSGHMSGEAMQRMGEFKMKHVPYSGSSQAMPDVLSGRVPLIFTTWTDIRPYHESGDLKVIALLGVNRLEAVPDIPTAGETLKGFNTSAFNGLAAPTGTPKPVLDKLAESVQTVVHSDTFKERIRALGSIPWGTSADETQAFLQAAYDKWQDVAKAAGITID